MARDSAFHHPITRVYLGLVVDDILARGPKLELDKFMETFQTKFLCTEPNHLTDDNSIDFSGLRLTRETKSNGQVGYYIDLILTNRVILTNIQLTTVLMSHVIAVSIVLRLPYAF